MALQAVGGVPNALGTDIGPFTEDQILFGGLDQTIEQSPYLAFTQTGSANAAVLGNGTLLHNGAGIFVLHTGSSGNGIANVIMGMPGIPAALPPLDGGSYNVIFGAGTAYNLNNSSDNVAIGRNAMEDMVDGGDFNVAIGAYALNQMAANADTNIAIGAYAMEQSGSSGINGNVVVGHFAARDIDGSRNIAIGPNALSDAGGEHNYGIFIGYDVAGNTNIGANEVVVIGRSALSNLNSYLNTQTIAIGSFAAASSTISGDHGLFIGRDAGRGAGDNTHANAISIGRSAGGSADGDHDQNIFLGNYAGYNVNSSNTNIAIGVDALRGATTEGSVDLNIAIGYRAAYGVSASTLIAIGDNAGRNGRANSVFIGSNAGRGHYGTGCIAIGTDALYSVGFSNGTNNIAIGGNSLGSLGSSDTRNVAVGVGTGAALTDGSDNVFIGYAAGNGVISRNENIFIGSRAGEIQWNGSTNVTGRLVINSDDSATNDFLYGDMRSGFREIHHRGTHFHHDDDFGLAGALVTEPVIIFINTNSGATQTPALGAVNEDEKIVGWHLRVSANLTTSGGDNTFDVDFSGVGDVAGGFTAVSGISGSANTTSQRMVDILETNASGSQLRLTAGNGENFSGGQVILILYKQYLQAQL